MGDVKKLTKNIVEVIVLFILFVFITIVLAIIGGTIEANQSEEEYNNGICSECSGHYKFVSSSHITNGSNEYYYSCEDCGYTIMTHIFYRGGS